MPAYIAFHKPYEVLSQFTDEAGRATLKDYISIPNVYAAGRLDYRSEGLLILSDDGRFIQRLADPRFEHSKVYLAQLEGIPTDEQVTRLQENILLPGLQTQLVQAQIIPDPGFPPRSKPVRPYHFTTWLRLVLKEGKKHEARRLTAAIGFPTLRLIRTEIGPVKLGDLKPGQLRILTTEEISAIFD
jgi:23S rRNA pseudouridine2457 synthase